MGRRLSYQPGDVGACSDPRQVPTEALLGQDLPPLQREVPPGAVRAQSCEVTAERLREPLAARSSQVASLSG